MRSQPSPIKLSTLSSSSDKTINAVFFFRYNYQLKASDGRRRRRRRRNHIGVRKSTDNAVTWPSHTIIETGNSAGYSCLVAGTVGAAHGGENAFLCATLY